MTGTVVSTQPVSHSSFTIERTYAQSLQKLFAAFSDPAKKRRWFAEGEGFIIDSYDLDFRVGGTERASFRTAATTGPIEAGTVFKNFAVYHDIVPEKRIVLAYTMSMVGKVDEQRFSVSLGTFEFTATGQGSTLLMTEQSAFFEGSDGTEMRKAGWNSLADALGKELAAF